MNAKELMKSYYIRKPKNLLNEYTNIHLDTKYRKITDRGFSGVHQIFVKPELRLNPSPVNIKFF